MRPPLLTGKEGWRRMVFSRANQVTLYPMEAPRQRYSLKLNEARRTLQINPMGDVKKKSVLTYRQPELGLLLLEGTFEGKKVRAQLRRMDESSFELVNRGFHWINEYPRNL